MSWWRSPAAWSARPDRRRLRRTLAATTPQGALAVGSGAVATAGCGPKAALLDRAAAAGLPVPAGVVIPHGTASDTAGIVRWAAEVSAPRLAVRSAFSAEDGIRASRAGEFHTVLRVPATGVDAATAIDAAVGDVRRSADGDDAPSTADAVAPAIRRDVLVMAMVDAVQAGVAFSEPGTYDDLVNTVSGTAEHLVSGDDPGERVLLARLEREPDGWRRRLQRLLAQVRREFGDRPWDVEWADDGTRCWLVQLRPITRPVRRNEALTIANHAEILPPLPSRLMTSLIAEAGPDLFAWYRRADRTLPADRPFLEVVAGRPFISLGLLEDLLRHLGLPTRLVADSIGGPPEHDRPARPARIARKAPVLARLGLAQVGAVATARRRERRAATIGASPAASFGAQLELLRDAYTGLVTGMFPLSSAIGPPLALLRRAGTLVEHAARHRTVTTELAMAVDDARRDGVGSDSWQQLLHRFGHRGVYESDIARPRYRDDPELLARAVGHDPRAVAEPVEPADTSRQLGSDRHTVPARTVRGLVTWPVWALARPPLAARERLRDAAMRGFADLRDGLVALADDAVADGRLPSVEHLWSLTVDEARRLDDGWRPDDEFWAARHAEIERDAALDPPAVVHRFDDPADWAPHTLTGETRLRGLPLTTGTVRGRAWVLREPAVDLPEGFHPASTVLVARTVDAGWVTTFTRVAAVVVETGGDLSHGSILLRERGVPAVTNVRGATRELATGDTVEVRADTGVVERVDAS